MGVLSAFGLNYAWQSYRNRNDRVYYAKAITAEIDLCVARLEYGFDLLPTDRWIAVLNSGVLRQFKHDQVDKLSKAYHGIQRFNLSLEIWNRMEIANIEPTNREETRTNLLEELKGLQKGWSQFWK